MKTNSPFQLMEKVSRTCTWVYYGFLGSVWLFFTALAVGMAWWRKAPGWMGALLFLLSAGMLAGGVLVTWLVLLARKRGTGKLTQVLRQRHGGTVRGADWRNLFRTDFWEGEVLGHPVSVMYARIPRRSGVEQIVSGQYDGGALLSAFRNSREYWQMGRGRFATQTVRVELPGDASAPLMITVAGRTKLGEAAGRHLSSRMKEIPFPEDPVAQAFIITSDDPQEAARHLAAPEFRQALFAAASWCAPMLASVRVQGHEAVFSGYVVPHAGPEQMDTLLGHLLLLHFHAHE